MLAFKGAKPCGCVVWLYSAEYDNQRERERTLKKAIERGLNVTPLRTEQEVEQARGEWTDCPHGAHDGKDAGEEARRLLEEVGA